MTPLLRFITVFNLESHFRAIMKPWFREVLFILFNNITYLYRVDKPAEKGGGGGGGEGAELHQPLNTRQKLPFLYLVCL